MWAHFMYQNGIGTLDANEDVEDDAFVNVKDFVLAVDEDVDEEVGVEVNVGGGK